MRSFIVVMLSPFFDDLARLLQAGEPVLVQAIVAEGAIKALAEGILDRLARLDKVELHSGLLCSEEHGLAGQFRAIVQNNLARQAIYLSQLVELICQPVTSYGGIDQLADTFAGEVIDDVQGAEPTTCCQLI